ncbi:hypothetical protein QG37_07137 [Candidozyma auris]|nr:hypothetical protein QG37_07137 [[Candida] auris]
MHVIYHVGSKRERKSNAEQLSPLGRVVSHSKRNVSHCAAEVVPLWLLHSHVYGKSGIVKAAFIRRQGQKQSGQ